MYTEQGRVAIPLYFRSTYLTYKSIQLTEIMSNSTSSIYLIKHKALILCFRDPSGLSHVSLQPPRKTKRLSCLAGDVRLRSMCQFLTC